MKTRGTLSLKEWASVCEALSVGEQVLLLRKGGIGEKRGFEIAGTSFVLFPTFEHQHLEKMRPEHARHFEAAMASQPPRGRLHLRSAASVVASVELTAPGEVADPDAVYDRTAPFHVYTAEHVAERVAYRPQAPLVGVILEVRPLREPLDLAEERRYAGCRSWVDLPPATFEAADPVVPRDRLERVRQRLGALEHLRSGA